MSSVYPDIFSSNKKFDVYTNIYPLVPGLVLVGWYIKIPNLIGSMHRIKNSEDATAIEATQERAFKHNGQHIRIGKHGILLLSGMIYDIKRIGLPSDKDFGSEKRHKDRRIVSEKVGIVRGCQIVDFRKTFERFKILEEVKKDHTRYINLIARDLIEGGYLEWRRREAAGKRPSIFDKQTIEAQRATSIMPSRRPHSYGCCKEYNEAPPPQQNKVVPAAPKSHKTVDQNNPQALIQPEQQVTPLTEENINAVPGVDQTQVGPRSYRSKHSGSDIERIHHKGVQIMNSTDGNSDIDDPPVKKHHSKAGRVISLYGEDSDPGTNSKRKYHHDGSFMNTTHKSSLPPAPPPSSDSGYGSSVSSSTHKSSHAPRSIKRKAKFTLDLTNTNHDSHILQGSGRTHKPSSDDGDETVYNIKVRKRNSTK